MKRDSVLVTGSSKGLGREISKVFARNGYDLIIHGRAENDLERVRKEIEKSGVEVFVVRGDITLDETIEELYSEAAKKDISVLINNAAPIQDQLFEVIEDVEIDEIISAALVAPIKLTRKIYEIIKKKAGTIININSLAGLYPQKRRTIYCAAKWGLRGFTETLRLESREYGVKVIGVYPSRIMTRPKYTYGWNPKEVAKKIFESFKNSSTEDLILDNRPEKYKK